MSNALEQLLDVLVNKELPQDGNGHVDRRIIGNFLRRACGEVGPEDHDLRSICPVRWAQVSKLFIKFLLTPKPHSFDLIYYSLHFSSLLNIQFHPFFLLEF